MRKKLHPFTRVALWASMAGLALNLLIFLLLFVFPPLFYSMTLDNVFITGVLFIAVFGPGLHAIIKYYFPGETVFERKGKPQGRDLRWILLSFGIMTLNVLIAWMYIHLAV